jgi:hypothetical protein|nr:MAG TPA: hypothetical protein [Caudoviricetes sp.]
MGIIVSVFPGCGREYLKKNCREGVTVENVRISSFDENDFPENYVDYVLSVVDKNDIVLISSHPAVCEELNKREVDFNLFYPERSRRNEIIENFVISRKPMKYIQEVDNKWTEWIDLIEERTLEHCFKHSLSKGQFIGNFPMMNEYVYNLLNSNQTVVATKVVVNGNDITDIKDEGLNYMPQDESTISYQLFNTTDLSNLSYIVNECNEKFEKFNPDSVGVLIDKDTCETLNKLKTWLEKNY